MGYGSEMVPYANRRRNLEEESGVEVEDAKTDETYACSSSHQLNNS